MQPNPCDRLFINKSKLKGGPVSWSAYFPLNMKEYLKTKSHPLMSWDISGQSYWGHIELASKMPDVKKLDHFSQKHQWIINWKKELLVHYEALVLTDNRQVIQWANHGFMSMTGYSVDYAIGKKAAFLQGTNTSDESRSQIRKQLNLKHRFRESIINYRKDGTEYLCQLSIIPLTNQSGKVTHFLAMESELK